ncbi:MAG: hypothetical protein WD055_02095 [Candidatus Dependentiae bacterium]
MKKLIILLSFITANLYTNPPKNSYPTLHEEQVTLAEKAATKAIALARKKEINASRLEIKKALNAIAGFNTLSLFASNEKMNKQAENRIQQHAQRLENVRTAIEIAEDLNTKHEQLNKSDTNTANASSENKTKQEKGIKRRLDNLFDKVRNKVKSVTSLPH